MNSQNNWNKKLEDLLEKDQKSFINNIEGIRSGKISVEFLRNIIINTSNKKSKLSHLTSLRSSSFNELVVTAFDKKDVQSIIKSILDSDLGLKLEKTERELMYFSLYPMTENSRKKLINKCKELFELAKISIRNNRQRILNEIKNSKEFSSDQEKKIKKNIEDLISSWNTKISDIYTKKVKELNKF